MQNNSVFLFMTLFLRIILSLKVCVMHLFFFLVYNLLRSNIDQQARITFLNKYFLKIHSDALAWILS